MVPTKIASPAELSKLIVEEYTFILADNSYKVIVFDESTNSESWTEIVSLAEIQDQVTRPDGMVDAPILNPRTQETTDCSISFDYYMAYEFDNEAKEILAAIISKKERRAA